MARAHVDDTPPASLNVDNGAPITTAVSLIVASNRTIYAIWFWVPTTNSGTYTVELWEITGDDDPGPAGGTLLASKAVAAAAVTAGQWNRVNLDTPVAVTTNKVYRAARHATSGRYVATSGAFTSGPISNAGITLVQSGTNPGALFPGVLRNGTFREAAAGNYPSSSFNASDYGVDVDDEDDSAPVPDPIDVAGAIGVGEPVVSGAATVLVPVNLVGGITVGAPIVAASITHPVTERPSGFETLTAMFRDARRNASQRVRITDCPKCGSPLEAARGVLHCPFDGGIY